MLEEKNIMSVLNGVPVKKGDAFFIETGTVHAIGAGIVLAEIQQTSDVTYRVYDWDRKDDRGNYRNLHTDLALDAIDYKSLKEYRSPYEKTLNKASIIVDNQYFTTNILPVKGRLKIDHSDKDSFIIYMCVKGNVQFQYGEGLFETLTYGETLLIPAVLKEFIISSEAESELLEIYIQ